VPPLMVARLTAPHATTLEAVAVDHGVDRMPFATSVLLATAASYWAPPNEMVIPIAVPGSKRRVGYIALRNHRRWDILLLVMCRFHAGRRSPAMRAVVGDLRSSSA
jgi:hypothetical protein